jgi:hypothetical protein
MKILKLTEKINAFGHPNIQAIHPTTLMITKDEQLSRAGDCVVAIAADKAVADLNLDFKEALRKPNNRLVITIKVGEDQTQVHAYGSPKLSLSNSNDIVIRKSDFISDRTLAIRANKSSSDLDRGFVKSLQSSKQHIIIALVINV